MSNPILTKKYHFCASHKYGNNHWSDEKNYEVNENDEEELKKFHKYISSGSRKYLGKAITLICLSRGRSVESAQFFIDGKRGSNRVIRPFEVRRNIERARLGSKAKSFLFIKEYSRSGCFRRTYDPYPIS